MLHLSDMNEIQKTPISNERRSNYIISSKTPVIIMDESVFVAVERSTCACLLYIGASMWGSVEEVLPTVNHATVLRQGIRSDIKLPVQGLPHTLNSNLSLRRSRDSVCCLLGFQYHPLFCLLAFSHHLGENIDTDWRLILHQLIFRILSFAWSWWSDSARCCLSIPLISKLLLEQRCCWPTIDKLSCSISVIMLLVEIPRLQDLLEKNKVSPLTRLRL